MATIDVKDAADVTVAIEKPLVPGRAAAAASRPVALSSEDKTVLDSVLAKIIAAPATEAKQDTVIAKLDTLNAEDFATQTTLAAILAKIIAAPATEAKQDTLIAKDFATQTTLASILAKIIAAPATEAKQDTVIAALAAIETAVELLDNAIAGNELQVDIVAALPAGTNLIGKTGIDQTTPGTTNAVDTNTARRGTLTSRSGAITTGTTSEQMMAANASRKYLLIQNPSTAAGQDIGAAETLYIRFGASAAGIDDGTSFELASGASIVMEGEFVSTEAIQVNATTTAHRWIAVEG